jgi:4-amino-4-deoxy-L-arabinose transferase-like glycosyltransferase
MLTALRTHLQTEKGIADLLAILLCVVAFIHGFNASHDLEWGNDLDHLRDVAAAQTILDGGFWDDPYYAGESQWYNPLTPTLVAAAARLTGAPLPTVHIRLGAYIDLLPAICFYILVASLFNRYVALASTACFLFFTSAPSHPTWASATYTPMLLPVVFAQAPFYLTLFAYRKAILANQRRYYAGGGGYSWE